jgi:hypothetical protein
MPAPSPSEVGGWGQGGMPRCRRPSILIRVVPRPLDENGRPEIERRLSNYISDLSGGRTRARTWEPLINTCAKNRRAERISQGRGQNEGGARRPSYGGPEADHGIKFCRRIFASSALCLPSIESKRSPGQSRQCISDTGNCRRLHRTPWSTHVLFMFWRARLPQNRSGPIIFESSQVNGRDGNGSHHTPRGP